MFAAPIATSHAHPALHLVENQKDVVFIGNSPELLQPFTAEMVVASLALDWLDDDRADINVALLDELVDLALGSLLPFDHVCFALRFRQRKIDVWTRDSRPIGFGEEIRLARIGIREAHGVA